MSRFVPLSIPNFEGNEQKYINDAVQQGWVSTGGAYISKLEKQIADYIKTHGVVACQSGTAAIHLSLVDCGVGPGDAVIVPTLTFIAAVNPIRYQFAEPIFMDCDDSLCMDPVKLAAFCEEECEMKEEKLYHKSTGKHIKAMVVVHIFGNMSDMVTIMDIANKYNIAVIEDATEALGTYYLSGKYKGKYAGTIGHYGAYSFNGNKIITTGGGGAVTAKNENSVKHLKYLSTQAKDDEHFYVHNEVGYNYRMTNLQAALGVAQMEELPDFIERKHKNYDLYKCLLKDFSLVKLLEFRKDTYSNQWFYSLEILMDRINGTMKDIIFKLEEKGVQTRAIWGLIHEQKPYRDAISYKIEKAKYYSEHILNIPSTTQLTDEDIRYTVKAIRKVLDEMTNA